MSYVRRSVFFAALSLCAAPAFAGPEFIEGMTIGGPDAGSTPGDAQTPTGIGNLGSIRGDLRGLAPTVGGIAGMTPIDIQDMYVICIEDPEAFSATLATSGGFAAGFDPRLYLFDLDGNGLLGNDDTLLNGNLAGSTVVVESTLTNMSDDGTPIVIDLSGLYLLAITVSPESPISNSEIFIFQSPTEVSGPDGPGADRPITNWTDNPVFGACCLPGGGCVDLPESICTLGVFGEYQGDDTFCIETTCPFGACCLPDLSCVEVLQSACEGELGGIYQGDGATCDDIVCLPPTGACCVVSAAAGSSLACLPDLTADECILRFGGSYQGDGTTCQDPEIECAPTGACCIFAKGGGCLDGLTLLECEASGQPDYPGFYQGDGTTCEDVDIDCRPLGACCFEDDGFSCIGGFGQLECEGEGGTFLGNGSTCGDPGCPPTGACCIFSKGSFCLDGLTPSECLAADEYYPGFYQGDGTTCEDLDIECAATGACCLFDGKGFYCQGGYTQLECLESGGSYQGDGLGCFGIDCTPGLPLGPVFEVGAYRIILTGACFPVSVPQGACTMPNDGCLITTQFDCAAMDGSYLGDDEPCPRPDNDTCESRLPIFEGITEFDTTGATTDGPPHAACARFGEDQIGQDIWYNYTASCDAALTVRLCGSTFDTKVAVYEGCACPISDAVLLGCDDDGCGTIGGASEVTVPVTSGNCYKVRIGGFGAASGTGIADLSLLPEQEQNPTLRLDFPDPAFRYEVGGQFELTLSMVSLCGSPAAGFQAFLEYDPSELIFDGATYSTAPFDLALIAPGDVNPEPGLINLAAGIDQTTGQGPTSADAALVSLSFTVEACGATVSFRESNPPSRLTNLDGGEIATELVDSPSPQCPGDVNGDGTVDAQDLIQVVNAWETGNCVSDINGDGVVNVTDLIEVITNWGDCP